MLLTLSTFLGSSIHAHENKENTLNQSVQPKAVFKILTKIGWGILQDDWRYHGNEADRRDGYIHLSKEDQLERVIEKYYRGVRPLYIVEFRSQEFLESLEWEPASNGDFYPHLYDSPIKWKDAYGYRVILKK